MNAAGTRTATYEAFRIGLSDGGTYDFSLNLDLSARNASLQVTNLNAPTMGLSGQKFGGSQAFLPSGSGLPASFSAVSESLIGSVDGPCESGCTGVAVAQPLNGNGRIADSIVHAVEVVAPVTTPGQIPRSVITASPEVTIPRQ